MDDYEKLLEKGFKEIPEDVSTSDRCEIPKVTGRVQGNTTIINNFGQICKFFNREPQHLLKFLLRELAAPGKIEGTRLILNRKLNPKLINSKIEEYAQLFVFCPVCKKPDTTLIEENGKLCIRCMACGAKENVKQKL